MAQELGPLQKKWVDALRSGKYQQGRSWLRSGDQYCCLGVACEVAGIPGEPEGEHFRYGRSSAVLPHKLRTDMRFQGEGGKLIGAKLGDHEYLVAANDKGVPFAEIADFIEDHPQAVFTEPA